MDPALQEEIRPGLDPDEVIEAIVRLRDKESIPPGIQIISQFGEIATCRVRRGNVREIYERPEIISFKAARLLTDSAYEDEETDSEENVAIDFSEINKLAEVTGEVTGKGVVVGIIDWGGDFAHADFIHPDGSTRFLALWDQTAPLNPKTPQPFGYGSAYEQDEINAALKTEAPYQHLGYHPGKGGAKGGSHGTHVMGIAAGNGRSGVRGVAPETDIIFVHLGSGDIKRFMKLGDSVKFLEAIDFIQLKAGSRPLVINASVGRHGGSHDGRSLVEMAMDYFLEQRTNTAICQSTGNYYQTNTHASGQVHPGRSQEVIFTTDKADVTPNELEVWYQPRDIFTVEVQHEESQLSALCRIDDKAELAVNNQVVGRIYHRSKEPNNGLNNINLYLYPNAPYGEWKIRLYGDKVVDGRFHIWIERDGGCRTCQSRFRRDFADRLTTTGTICNGYNTIVVGAMDNINNTISKFSSSGPTLDGRTKPNLLAPGVNIWAARSSPLRQPKGGQKLTRMSGTSMATPHVAGTVALMLSLVEGAIDIHALRSLLLKSTVPMEVAVNDRFRAGSGLLDIKRAIEATKEYTQALNEEALSVIDNLSFMPTEMEESTEPAYPSDESFARLSEESNPQKTDAESDYAAEQKDDEAGAAELYACDGYGEEDEHVPEEKAYWSECAD